MTNMNQAPDTTLEERGSSLQSFMQKSFITMALGLAVTAAVAYVCYQSLMSGGFVYDLFTSSPWTPLILCGVQLGLVVFFTARIGKMQPATATICFYAYACLTGVTFSFLPLAFGVDTMYMAFGFSSLLFVCMAVIGHTTKVDLTRFQPLLFVGLFVIVIISIVGLFINLSFMQMAICYVGLALFLILTAFDIQKMKQQYYSFEDQPDMLSKASIYSALQLYLDFINIFLYVLRIMGRSSKK